MPAVCYTLPKRRIVRLLVTLTGHEVSPGAVEGMNGHDEQFRRAVEDILRGAGMLRAEGIDVSVAVATGPCEVRT